MLVLPPSEPLLLAPRPATELLVTEGEAGEDVGGDTHGRALAQGMGAAPTLKRSKLTVFNEVVERVREAPESLRGYIEDTFENDTACIQQIRSHFLSLPARYAFDLDTDRPEDIFLHMKLLKKSRASPLDLHVHVRQIDDFVAMRSHGGGGGVRRSPVRVRSSMSIKNEGHEAVGEYHGSSAQLPGSLSQIDLRDYGCILDDPPTGGGLHGLSSPSSGGNLSSAVQFGLERVPPTNFVEVTCVCGDRPKMLMAMSASLSNLDLNIEEAHVFTTVDHHTMDIFIVSGWEGSDGIEALESALNSTLQPLIHSLNGGAARLTTTPGMQYQGSDGFMSEASDSTGEGYARPSLGAGSDFDIDYEDLEFFEKVGEGSMGVLMRGLYMGQEVAIKTFNKNPKQDLRAPVDSDEFWQEINIMRRLRHKNVVQFIGAVTTGDRHCIVTEFMSGGSVYELMRSQQPNGFDLDMAVRIAKDAARGMLFMHRNNIVHRDLKCANLLIDENKVVKIADFGVARVMDKVGVMTAETGTYRWMAPEVIEHKNYGLEVDVYSFGILFWELLTGKVPYSKLSPLQAAVGVVQHRLRPMVNNDWPASVKDLLRSCWEEEPGKRPTFEQIGEALNVIANEESKKVKKPVSFFGW